MPGVGGLPVAGLNWITLVVASMLAWPSRLSSGGPYRGHLAAGVEGDVEAIGVLFEGSSGLTLSISTFMVQLFSNCVAFDPPRS